MTIREYSSGDIAALISLWHSVFGDSEELAASFFSLLPHMGTFLVAEEDGKVIGMSGIITGCELISAAGSAKKCAYIYAVAVTQSRRGEGIGRALTAASADISRKLGAEIICTLPAEDGLYPYYEKYLGTSHILFRERRPAPAAAALCLAPISPESYYDARERLLSAEPHMRPSLSLLRAEHNMCTLLHGGLFSFDGGICCGYAEDGRCRIVELLCADENQAVAAASSLAHALGCEYAEYYLPCGSEGCKYMVFSQPVDGRSIWNLCLD